ncbi:lysozyme inhibitor LprI family protein [Synechocystis sp. PCC 7509]|uniref:lysozyme inhibitor LprI family protein n=1 Tax=Synechocystis sp. PCC 7509 TaxID=927677 RepID=UPI0002ABE884|nr:lysozyme inhibitor LprI family protein [Synechocystis sp. PCC 7509]
MKWYLLAVIFASLFSEQTIATPQLAQTINCGKATNTVELNECTGREAKAADRKLNQVYQQLRPKISTKQRQRLTQAQLDWIKFRDRTCEYEAGEWEGGTGASAAYLSCLARVTTQRTADLQRYLDR